MMLRRRTNPRTQKPRQRLQNPARRRRMRLQHPPLILIRTTRLIQNLRRHRQLPHIMQQHRPPQPIQILTRNPHLRTNHLRIRPHPLRMPTRPTIMRSQHRHQLHRLTSRLTLISRQPRNPILQLPNRPRTQRQPKPRRRLIRKHQRHRHQRRQRRKTLTKPRHHMRHHTRNNHRLHHPTNRPNPTLTTPKPTTQQPNRQPPQHHRHHIQRHTDRDSHPRARAPGLRFGFVGPTGRTAHGRMNGRSAASPQGLFGSPEPPWGPWRLSTFERG